MPELPKVGDRIRLLLMPHDPDPIPPGSLGTVTRVVEHYTPLPSSHSLWVDGAPIVTQLLSPDATAQIGVEWDNGRSLSLSIPMDTFEVIDA